MKPFQAMQFTEADYVQHNIHSEPGLQQRMHMHAMSGTFLHVARRAFGSSLPPCETWGLPGLCGADIGER